jgi:hypothetical protein
LSRFYLSSCLSLIYDLEQDYTDLRINWILLITLPVILLGNVSRLSLMKNMQLISFVDNNIGLAEG